MEDLLGTTVGVYVGITLLLMSGAAFLTGQAVAMVWRPAGQIAAYALLLVLANRFLIFALFEGAFLTLPGVLIDYAVLGAVALAAHRLTHVAKTVSQYPWLYERAGLWGYRAKGSVGG